VLALSWACGSDENSGTGTNGAGPSASTSSATGTTSAGAAGSTSGTSGSAGSSASTSSTTSGAGGATGAGGAGSGSGGAPGDSGAGSGGKAGGAGNDAGRLDASAADQSAPAALQIGTIAINQGVQINLMKDGQTPSKLNAPIVKNRPALVRVYVQTPARWTAHDVSAQLDLAGTPKSQTIGVAGASVDGDLGTTFNFELSAAETNVDTLAWSVTIHDATSGAADLKWPATGTSAMTLKSSGASIKIVYVPFNYQVGGQTILADASPAAIKILDDALFAAYPTAKIESSVHAPMTYTGPAIQAEGGGWSQALAAVGRLRQQDRPATNVYYYGLVAPAPTLMEYCPTSCVGGVANIPASPTSTGQFASMGVSYHDPYPSKKVEDMEVRVALQEVAHDFGRLHAFCQVPDGGTPATGLDPNYPYKTGSVGVWGYDLLKKRLYDPATFMDIQSYCNPVWISDYTYSAIFDWVTRVNAGAPIVLESAPDPSPEELRYIRF
jgi:hypothetical protein